MPRATRKSKLKEPVLAPAAPPERSDAEGERDVLRRQLAAAEEAERRRLARELHDQLGQHLTALTLGLDEVAAMLPLDSPAVPRLAGLLRLTTILTRDVRYVAVELRPPELDDVGLESAMATYITQWSARYGVEAELETTGFPARPLSGETSTAVYRILQEALTNVAKHAGAKQVSVILEHADANVRLIIEDDGCGFDVENARARARAESRFGLAGMQERAILLHGAMEVESQPGNGTTVYVRLQRDD